MSESVKEQPASNNGARGPEPSKKSDSSDPDAKYGYDLYPERKGSYKPSLTRIVFGGEGTEATDKMKCEKNVYNCVQKNPLVKLMMAALKSSGCAVDIRRHISCEYCEPLVTGGYDPVTNQIVVCQNTARKEGVVQGALFHEMIHMFDYCRNELDFKNLDHLACTEIRAANLAHCSFMGAYMQGDASLFNLKQRHQACVKTKALASVMSVREVSPEEAIAAVNRVFSKCYNDLEPIGRRIRRNSYDVQKAYMEAPYYGYE